MKLNSSNLKLFPRSLVSSGGLEYGLAVTTSGKRLAVLGSSNHNSLADFDGETASLGNDILLLGPLNTHNIAALRNQLSYLQPCLLGLKTSAGTGDRLGLATPGHVRAFRAVNADIAPIFAQQSIREMTRTGRTPQQVMDDAAWGMFEEGWQDGAGADADHLKTLEDISACLAAGYTFFTIDPGEHVDNRAELVSTGELHELADQLLDDVRPRASGLHGRFFRLEGLKIEFDEPVLLKAAVKYGRAVAHVSRMYRYLQEHSGAQPFELEVSVDETEQPTTHAEHFYIASELKRLGVKWVSLAPRYLGTFEKGVDYIGNVTRFESDLVGHAAIARHFGPYKLSLHSGSDKFRIYPAAFRQTQGLVHLKTAGTSYLEALRTASAIDPALFEEIYIFARERYEPDRQSYHVSARLDRAPAPGTADLPSLLDQFDAREILHVTFGSVLTERRLDGGYRFYHRLMGLLESHPEAYAANLERHFVRHLEHFVSGMRE